MICNPIVRLIGIEHREKSLNNPDSESMANLGCFIQPSRCMWPLASLSCWPGELPLSRHRPSDRCREQSLDMPHVAGRQGEHFGWHKAWHSEEKEKTLLKRERCRKNFCLLFTSLCVTMDYKEAYKWKKVKLMLTWSVYSRFHSSTLTSETVSDLLSWGSTNKSVFSVLKTSRQNI